MIWSFFQAWGKIRCFNLLACYGCLGGFFLCNSDELEVIEVDRVKPYELL
jgi:hypothetical protein